MPGRSARRARDDDREHAPAALTVARTCPDLECDVTVLDLRAFTFTRSRAPSFADSTREVIVICETEPIEANASPRKPRVRMWNRSSDWTNFEVA